VTNVQSIQPATYFEHMLSIVQSHHFSPALSTYGSYVRYVVRLQCVDLLVAGGS